MDNQLKVLQINTCNFGSTGNIMLNISKTAQENGYSSYVAYANSRSNKKKRVENCILIGSILERNLHLRLAYYTGYNGCFSQIGTKKFINQIDEIRPDIIHLHNLHNCYINLKMLFEYIKKKGFLLYGHYMIVGLLRDNVRTLPWLIVRNGRRDVMTARSLSNILKVNWIKRGKCMS